jgi:hypothetical protein
MPGVQLRRPRASLDGQVLCWATPRGGDWFDGPDSAPRWAGEDGADTCFAKSIGQFVRGANASLVSADRRPGSRHQMQRLLWRMRRIVQGGHIHYQFEGD